MKQGGSRVRDGGSLLSELAVPGGLLVLNQLLKKRNRSKKNKIFRKKTFKSKKAKVGKSKKAKVRKSKKNKISKRR